MLIKACPNDSPGAPVMGRLLAFTVANVKKGLGHDAFMQLMASENDRTTSQGADRRMVPGS